MSSSYRDALVSSGERKRQEKESSDTVDTLTSTSGHVDTLTSTSEPIDTLTSTSGPDSSKDIDAIESGDVSTSQLSSSPDLDTKEVPLIPSPKPDHFDIVTRQADRKKDGEESRESPDSSAGSSFKKLPDSDDASDENGHHDDTPASSGSDNDYDHGHLNVSDDADEVTEGPDTHLDSSVTEGPLSDQETARNERGPDQLPPTVTVLDGPHDGKVYLIGTAHFSAESQRDVEEVIRKMKPNVVVLELCSSRLSILSINEEMLMKESSTLTLAKVQENVKAQGIVQGIMYSLFLSLSAQLTRELGMAPGGEFRRAVAEAKKIPGCIVQLGDRPVDVTLRRAVSSLSLWQKIKLGLGIIFSKPSITKEEVEKCKQRDLLEEMLKEITGEFPTLSKCFVDERDIYLAYSLQLACCPFSDVREPGIMIPSKVVGVVGIGHVPGIAKNWGRIQDADIPPLMKIPEQTLTTFLVIKSLKYSLSGLAIWGLYKLLAPKSLSRLASETLINFWNETLLKIMSK